MYFGCGGSAAIPRMLNELAIAVLEDTADQERIGLEVELSEIGRPKFSLWFKGLACRTLSDFQPDELFDWGSQLRAQLAMTVAASESCVLQVFDRHNSWELRVSDKPAFLYRRLARKAQPGIKVQACLHQPTFGTLTSSEFHRLGSMLRDLSILRPGLATSLRMGKSELTLAWRYPEGLKAFVAEMDHSRWPLHADCLQFADEREGMKVEGCVRFVHAGVPEIRSWVNFHPSHGGAHYEGFGDALKKVFPDAKAGCRRVRFTTNPDENAWVMLPHPFVAAMHVQLSDPKFAGPTKDILLGQEVREFVREAASAALPKQWAELRKRRN
jgi:DNA gyrase/topoisomerase IV subunit B